MSESSKETQIRKNNGLSLDKRADILQASFEHYYKMAMDHHTKAATTSNLLLIIVGALITLVGHDNNINDIADLVGGLVLSLSEFLGQYGF